MAGSIEDGCCDGIGSKARFFYPKGVTCSSDGSKVAVADECNQRLRLIHTATNQVITIAGNGQSKRSDGQALVASIPYPRGLVFDRTTLSPDSVLYFTAGSGGIVWRIDFSSGHLQLRL